MRKLSLIVASPFADYKKGQEIFDPSEIENLLNGDNASLVIKSSYEFHEEKKENLIEFPETKTPEKKHFKSSK